MHRNKTIPDQEYDRLFDRLRAEQGASYGPVVDSHWPTGFVTGGYLVVGSLLTAREQERGTGRDEKGVGEASLAHDARY